MGANKKLAVKGYAVTVCIYLLSTLWLMGVFGSYTGGELAVWFLTLYFAMPITAFVTSLVFGVKDAFLNWLYPLVFGAYGVVLPYWVSYRFNPSAGFSIEFEPFMLSFALVPAVAGILIGWGIRQFRKGA